MPNLSLPWKLYGLALGFAVLLVLAARPAAALGSVYHWISSPDTAGVNGLSGHATTGPISMSQDGRFLCFITDAAYDGNDTNGHGDVYVYDRATGTREWVSSGADGSPGDYACHSAQISGDGRFVVFLSGANNLVANDSNPYQDVFLRDRTTGTLEFISAPPMGGWAWGPSFEPVMSSNGRYIVFVSDRRDLIEDPTVFGSRYLYRKDRTTGTFRYVAIENDGVTPVTDHYLVARSVSSNGRLVTFSSMHVWNAGDSTGGSRTYRRDMQLAASSITVAEPAEANSGTILGMADDGTKQLAVIYGDDFLWRHFVRDVSSGGIMEASILPSGTSIWDDSETRALFHGAISRNARYYTFRVGHYSGSDFWVRNYVRDLILGCTEFIDERTISQDDWTYQGQERQTVSDTGRSIAFNSLAPINIGDSSYPDWDWDVYLQERAYAGIAGPTLTAGLNGDGEVVLTWEDRFSRENGFQVLRWNGSAYVVVHTTGPNATSWTDPTAIPDFRNLYQVRAFNAAATGALSNKAAVTTPPLPPTNLTATALSSSRIRLTWTDTSVTETGFRIERSTGGAFSAVGSVAANRTLFENSGLAPGTSYSYRVVAVNGLLASAPSTPTVGQTIPLPPPAPTNLVATLSDPTTVRLDWTDNSSGTQAEDGFRIWRSAAGSAYEGVATVAANSTSFIDPDRMRGVRYLYYVTAYNLGGSSRATNKASITPPLELPLAPSGLTATLAAPTTIRLNWTDNSGPEGPAAGFRVWRSTGGAYEQIASVDASEPAYHDTNRAPTVRYIYYVTAHNARGTSRGSNKVALTVPQ
jgi:fibronectin type 3 domain-containing protein